MFLVKYFTFENILLRNKPSVSYKIDCNQRLTVVNIINITTYFENLIIKLHVFYALNTHVKFVSIGYYLSYNL